MYRLLQFAFILPLISNAFETNGDFESLRGSSRKLLLTCNPSRACMPEVSAVCGGTCCADPMCLYCGNEAMGCLNQANTVHLRDNYDHHDGFIANLDYDHGRGEMIRKDNINKINGYQLLAFGGLVTILLICNIYLCFCNIY